MEDLDLDRWACTHTFAESANVWGTRRFLPRHHGNYCAQQRVRDRIEVEGL
jgi:hypothetical protein